MEESPRSVVMARSSRSSGVRPRRAASSWPSTIPIESRSWSGMHQLQPAAPRAISTCPGGSSQRKPSKCAKCATSLRGPSRAGIPSARATWRARPVASTMRSGCRSARPGAAASVSGASSSSAPVSASVPACSCARAARGDAGGDRLGEQRLVEARARDVVGVGEDGRREAVERDADAVVSGPDEGHAGLDAAEARRLFLDPELPEDRDHGGDERLADQQLRRAAVVEERDVVALAGEQDGQRGPRRARPR